MKKKLLLTLLLALALVLSLSASAFAEARLDYVTDEAGILSEEERTQLNAQAGRISEQYQCGVYVVIVNDYRSYVNGSIETFAEEVFAGYDLGYGDSRDGVMLAMSMADRDYDLYAHGSFGNYAFTDYGKGQLAESFLDNFRRSDWAAGFRDFVDMGETLIRRARDGDPLDQWIPDPAEEQGPSLTPGKLLLSAVISALGTYMLKDIIDGYIRAAEMVIDKLCEPSGDSEGCDSDSVDHAAASADSTSGPSVNLIGFSLYQKYHAGDIAELTRLLGLCGIKVNTAFLCESTVDEIRKLSKADLNVVVDPDWGLKIAEELEDRFGTPFIESEYGYPVGFKAAEKLISDICSKLSADPEPALDELKRARAKAYIELARINSLTGLPKGASYKVTGTPAVKRGYSTFLTEYLGMTESDDDPEIVLGDGNTIARMKAEGRRFSGIEISLPTIGYIDVIDKTHIGSIGGLFLIEQILNSFVY